MQPVPMPARISESQKLTSWCSGLDGGWLAEAARLEPSTPDHGGGHGLRLALAFDHGAAGPMEALTFGEGEQAGAAAVDGRFGVGHLPVGRGLECRSVGTGQQSGVEVGDESLQLVDALVGALEVFRADEHGAEADEGDAADPAR